jgi:hypothetical protein
VASPRLERGYQRPRARHRRDPFGKALVDRGFGQVTQQAHPLTQGGLEIQFALHRALGDRRDLVLDPAKSASSSMHSAWIVESMSETNRRGAAIGWSDSSRSLSGKCASRMRRTGRIAFQHFEFEHLLAPFEHSRAGHFPAAFLDRFHRARKIVTKRLRLCYQAGDEHR